MSPEFALEKLKALAPELLEAANNTYGQARTSDETNALIQFRVGLSMFCHAFNLQPREKSCSTTLKTTLKTTQTTDGL